MEQPLRFFIFPGRPCQVPFPKELGRGAPEREDHILDHAEMVGLLERVGHALSAPERVVLSASDPAVELFYTFQRDTKVGDKWLCVVVKYIVSDAFVVTAYLNDKIKKESNDGP